MKFLSLLALGLITACGNSADDDHSDQDHSGHDHSSHDHSGHNHAAPMGGKLIELGAHEFQVEVVHYPETGVLEAYVWDGHAAREVPIAMKTITVSAKIGDATATIQLTGEVNLYGKAVEGKWSKFKGQHDSLKKMDHFDGTLGKMTIAGKSFEAASFHYHAGGDSGEHDQEH